MTYQVITLHINTFNFGELKNYIEKRYDRYLDYAMFHSSRAGIPDEAIDVLNEVLLNLLQRDSQKLESLLNTKKGQYTELDFYVLQSIKLNCHSPLSPYQYRYNKFRFDRSINLSRLKIIDEHPDDEVDNPALILKHHRFVRWVFDGLELSELERAVFAYKFIHGLPFSEWPGTEKAKKLYATYNSVRTVIHAVLFTVGLTKIPPKGNLTDYQNKTATRFVNTHKILIKNNLKIKSYEK